jgi:hypothetical protein
MAVFFMPNFQKSEHFAQSVAISKAFVYKGISRVTKPLSRNIVNRLPKYAGLT